MKTYYEWFEEQKFRNMPLGESFQRDFDIEWNDKLWNEPDPQKAGLMIFNYLVNSKLWPYVPQVGRCD